MAEQKGVDRQRSVRDRGVLIVEKTWGMGAREGFFFRDESCAH